MPMFSNLREDWRTYEKDVWRQGLWVMTVYRLGTWRNGIKMRLLRAPFSLVYRVLKALAQSLTGVDLPCEVKLGQRFRIEHSGSIVIAGGTEFGDDCVIGHGVTCAPKQRDLLGTPRIGNRVEIGAGAKLLGPITIGDGAIIGANAVVIRDVPAGALAVGVPATIKLRKPPPGLVDEHVPDAEAPVREPSPSADHEREKESVLVG